MEEWGGLALVMIGFLLFAVIIATNFGWLSEILGINNQTQAPYFGAISSRSVEALVCAVNSNNKGEPGECIKDFKKPSGLTASIVTILSAQGISKTDKTFSFADPDPFSIFDNKDGMGDTDDVQLDPNDLPWIECNFEPMATETSNNIIEYEEGSLWSRRTNVCYKYDDGEWKWELAPCLQNRRVLEFKPLAEMYPANEDTIDKVHKDVSSGLMNADFEEGLKWIADIVNSETSPTDGVRTTDDKIGIYDEDGKLQIWAGKGDQYLRVNFNFGGTSIVSSNSVNIAVYMSKITNEGEKKCTIHNFYMPQLVGREWTWDIGLGDANYIIYYETMPEDEVVGDAQSKYVSSIVFKTPSDIKTYPIENMYHDPGTASWKMYFPFGFAKTMFLDRDSQWKNPSFYLISPCHADLEITDGLTFCREYVYYVDSKKMECEEIPEEDAIDPGIPYVPSTDSGFPVPRTTQRNSVSDVPYCGEFSIDVTGMKDRQIFLDTDEDLEWDQVRLISSWHDIPDRVEYVLLKDDIGGDDFCIIDTVEIKTSEGHIIKSLKNSNAGTIDIDGDGSKEYDFDLSRYGYLQIYQDGEIICTSIDDYDELFSVDENNGIVLLYPSVHIDESEKSCAAFVFDRRITIEDDAGGKISPCGAKAVETSDVTYRDRGPDYDGKWDEIDDDGDSIYEFVFSGDMKKVEAMYCKIPGISVRVTNMGDYSGLTNFCFRKIGT